MDDEHKQVQRWASWSRRFTQQWVDERDASMIAHHDESVEDLKKSLRVQGVDANASLVTGLAFAFQLVVDDEDLDPAVKHRIGLALAVKTGLAAEAAESTWDNFKFAAITSQLTKRSVREPEGGRRMRTLPLRGTFSCNKYGDVWRPTGYGFTPPAERTNLKGTDPRLDAAVRQVVAARPAGGRFEITGGAIFLADGHRRVA